MLLLDTSRKIEKKNHIQDMEQYLKGVYDAAGDFKAEEHPREKSGENAGQFTKSEKTKQKEDEVDKVSLSPKQRRTWYNEPDDKKIEVPKEVLNNLNKTSIINENLSLLLEAASSQHTSPKDLDKLAFAERYTSSNANCEIQEAVSLNPSTSTETLKHLVGFPEENEEGGRSGAAKRYNTSSIARNARKQLVDRGLKKYAL